ncbi:MAG: ferrochelatase [Bacteroidetes bacterium]|nr:MAG: ferrochelatase [Bacteroidota bacterium]TAG85984.1 MAG: ferrochelatase [Bacteroidota bacterium]
MEKNSTKIGVLLVNLGTPDSPNTPDVRKYLREFLMDKRVVDVPFALRWALVNLIIAPFRAPKSAKIYKEVWTEKGSPLKVYGYEIKKLLQEALGENFVVELGMRYQSPSIQSGLENLRNKGYARIIVIPLFPQYASASTGSVQDKVMEIVKNWQIIPEISFVQSFFDHPLFIEAFAANGNKYLSKEKFDHVIFSYHGLPERQIRKADHTKTCLVDAKKDKSIAGNPNCCAVSHDGNRGCYRANCFATSRLLAEKLGLEEKDYTVCFQSRLGNDPWIKPYTDLVIKDLVKQGKKKIIAFSPSFVSDCLETTIEIGEEYKEIFEEAGGEHWQFVESLNDSALWIDTLVDLVQCYSQRIPRMEERILSEKIS